MRRVAAALIFALLAVPVAAQVEIRGLTIAAPDKPGNGGIMLKSVISTRLPGEISFLTATASGVSARVDNDFRRLILRDGVLVSEQIQPFPLFNQISAAPELDLDSDGRKEVVAYRNIDGERQLVVYRQLDGDSQIVASRKGYGKLGFLEIVDVTRALTPQILAVSDANNCLDVLSFSEGALKKIGSLSCGALLIDHVLQADIDNDGRYDLIVARQPDRIEIFLR
jgi:hypothetical protein